MNLTRSDNIYQELEFKINQWLDFQGIKLSQPEEKKLDQFDQFRQKAFSQNRTESQTECSEEETQTKLQINTSPLLQKRKRLLEKKLSLQSNK